MYFRSPRILILCVLAFVSTQALADPCGMVPPIYSGEGSPIARIGLQQTYVFFDRGVESFVIRPGFQGKVDNFGMLIPFPTAPEIRKIADNTFEQIANAVDPPEVLVDLRRFPPMGGGGGGFGGGGFGGGGAINRLGLLKKDEVRVVKEEAVGMYEVAVLEAGSPAALKKWMDKNKFVYPKGMDETTNDYIEMEWCFVAVKTKVAEKTGTDPQPGQRRVKPGMPADSLFDGHVQGLGFRFRTEELVVPMRLSAFNPGSLRNVVYLLTRGGQRIKAIPEEFVMRQISGKDLFDNMVGPLPLRILGGGLKDIPVARRESIQKQRDPAPHSTVAKELFAADIAVSQQRMSPKVKLTLRHEEREKELSRIAEHFGLRGPEIDSEIAEATKDYQTSFVEKGLAVLGNGRHRFVLSVIDGDFPREVIARQNLKFERYRMVARRNTPRFYDVKRHGPAPEKVGKLISATNPWWALDAEAIAVDGQPEFRTDIAWITILASAFFALVWIGKSRWVAR